MSDKAIVNYILSFTETNIDITNNNTYLSCIRKLLKNACTNVNKMTQNCIKIRQMQIALLHSYGMN